MKTKKIIIVLLILIIVLSIGCHNNSRVKDNNDNNIFFFPIYPAKINSDILTFMSEFINYTEKEYGKDEKYALYLENLIGDRHLITMSLIPKSEKFDLKKYNGVFRFQNKIVFFSLSTESIFESNSTKEIKINDYKYFYWQLIIILNKSTLRKVTTIRNDTMNEITPITTELIEKMPSSFDNKPLEEKVIFKKPLNK